MAQITSFNAGTWNEIAKTIEIISNSSLSNLQVDDVNKKVSFNVAGPQSTHGFCRLTIPNAIVQNLWKGNYTVLINNVPWPFENWTDTASTYIYINYTHSTEYVGIVPEFPSPVTLLFLTLATVTVAITLRKRHTK